MKHVGTQTLTTPRLLLRRYTLADAEAMYAGWATDAEVARHLRWEPHAGIDETRAVLSEWVAAYGDDHQYLWAITLKDTGTLIGSIGISLGRAGPTWPALYEPAYCLARPYWGQGYTTEALRACLEYFIAATGCREMVCSHAVDNPASGAVMQKAGFCYLHNGVYHKFNGTEVPARYYRLVVEPSPGPGAHAP